VFHIRLKYTVYGVYIRYTAYIYVYTAYMTLKYTARNIPSYVLCVVFVCWLRLAFVPLSVVLGALGSLGLLSILTIHSVCYPRPCQL
jgi:hypothetical protein